MGSAIEDGRVDWVKIILLLYENDLNSSLAMVESHSIHGRIDILSFSWATGPAPTPNKAMETSNCVRIGS